MLTKKLLYVALSTMVLACCTPEEGEDLVDPNNPPAKEIEYGMEAKIGKTSWKAVNFSIQMIGKNLIISGTSDTMGTITIHLQDTAVGTYYLNPASGNYAFVADTISDALGYTFGNSLAGGAVIINKVDRDSLTISGNFIFTAYNGVRHTTTTYSQGSFINIPYSETSLPKKGMISYINNKKVTADSVKAGIAKDEIMFMAYFGNDEIGIDIKNVFKGNYPLGKEYAHLARYNTIGDTILYTTKDNNYVGGIVSITNITKDSLASGSFVFTVYRAKDRKIMNFNRGIFNDIKLNNYTK
ncbi:MAG TPA: DUF6252 family protein [Bacteroidales bacterium]|nr:DUF6252 family protein [Bacteroidales bacterium]